MAALEPAFINSLSEPPFRDSSVQSRRLAGQSNVTGSRKHEFHGAYYPPCFVKTWSRRDQYGHLFALNDGEGLSLAHLARPYRFRRRTSSSPTPGVVKQVPELGSDAVLFRFARCFSRGIVKVQNGVVRIHNHHHARNQVVDFCLIHHSTTLPTALQCCPAPFRYLSPRQFIAEARRPLFGNRNCESPAIERGVAPVEHRYR